MNRRFNSICYSPVFITGTPEVIAGVRAELTAVLTAGLTEGVTSVVTAVVTAVGAAGLNQG